MINSNWPQTVDEAAEICLSVMTPEEKQILKYTPDDRLVWFHFDWAVSMKTEFGMEEGNTALMDDCGDTNPDEASMVIFEAVRLKLNQQI
jgi:hypothetical protein